MRPIRKEMVESQLYQLRESLGGGRPPVARKQLWVMYSEKNASSEKSVGDLMIVWPVSGSAAFLTSN
jgi:hypothetical protein